MIKKKLLDPFMWHNRLGGNCSFKYLREARCLITPHSMPNAFETRQLNACKCYAISNLRGYVFDVEEMCTASWPIHCKLNSLLAHKITFLQPAVSGLLWIRMQQMQRDMFVLLSMTSIIHLSKPQGQSDRRNPGDSLIKPKLDVECTLYFTLKSVLPYGTELHHVYFTLIYFNYTVHNGTL